MSLDPVKNFAKVTLSTGYGISDVSVILSSGNGSKLPNPGTDGNFNAVWWNSTDFGDPSDDPNREIVRVTSKSTDTLTIIRAQEGTAASTKNTANKVYQMVLAVTAKTITDILALIPALPTWTKDSIANTRMTGAIDGVNLIYFVSQIPVAMSGILQANGRTLTEGVDYSVSTSLKKITMSTPLPIEAASLPFEFKYQY